MLLWTTVGAIGTKRICMPNNNKKIVQSVWMLSNNSNWQKTSLYMCGWAALCHHRYIWLYHGVTVWQWLYWSTVRLEQVMRHAQARQLTRPSFTFTCLFGVNQFSIQLCSLFACSPINNKPRHLILFKRWSLESCLTLFGDTLGNLHPQWPGTLIRKNTERDLVPNRLTSIRLFLTSSQFDLWQHFSKTWSHLSSLSFILKMWWILTSSTNKKKTIRFSARKSL